MIYLISIMAACFTWSSERTKRVGFSQFSHDSVVGTMLRSIFYPLTSPSPPVSFPISLRSLGEVD